MAEAVTKDQGRVRHPPRLDSAAFTRRNSEASPNLSPLPSSGGHSRINTPSTSIPSTPIIPARLPSPERKPLPASNSNSFLTALAAQERRVLELKEELQKAETDLEKLKKQWAAHEATRKRNEAKQLEQLRPLKAARLEMSPIGEDEVSMKPRELERRKTLSSSTKTTQRKVFEGSRHVRTLSLLSTAGSKTNGNSEDRRIHANTEDAVSPSSTADSDISIRQGSKAIHKTSDKDVFLETGKQIVGDFRQGFWTFVEDLRQVTVGDDNVEKTSTRKVPVSAMNDSNSTSRMDKEKGAIGNEKQETQLSYMPKKEQPEVRGTPRAQTKANRHKINTASSMPTTDNLSDAESESWDDWGTPLGNSNVKKTPNSHQVVENSSPITTWGQSKGTET